MNEAKINALCVCALFCWGCFFAVPLYASEIKQAERTEKRGAALSIAPLRDAIQNVQADMINAHLAFLVPALTADVRDLFKTVLSKSVLTGAEKKYQAIDALIQCDLLGKEIEVLKQTKPENPVQSKATMREIEQKQIEYEERAFEAAALKVPLDLVVLFADKSAGENSEVTLAFQELAEGVLSVILFALEERIPAICSTYLLYALFVLRSRGMHHEMREILERIYDPHECIIAHNQANDFAVLLPRAYIDVHYPELKGVSDKQILEYLGFSSQLVLDEKRKYDDDALLVNLCNVDHFKSLFDLSIIGPRKRIFLNGHGGTNHVALMNRSQFQDFLRFLIPLNTEFIFIRSCCTGGENLLAMQSFLKQNQEYFIEKMFKSTRLGKSRVKYALASAATLDFSIKSSDYSNANERGVLSLFFQRLDQFLRNPQWYAKLPYAEWQNRKTGKKEKLSIKEVLEPLEQLGYSSFKLHEAQVISICYPGSTVFRLLEFFPSTFVLTYARMKQYLLDYALEVNKLEQPVRNLEMASQSTVEPEKRALLLAELVDAQQKLDAFLLRGAVITIPQEKTKIFVYPSMLLNVCINVSNAEVQKFFSMIPSKAIHVIDKLQTTNGNSEIFLKKLLKPIVEYESRQIGPEESERLEVTGDYSKAWLIRELVDLISEALQIKMYGVVVYKKVIGTYKTEDLFMYTDGKNNFWQATMYLKYEDRFNWQPITAEQYRQKIREIKKETMPTDEALEYASGGNETQEQLAKAIDEFVQSVAPGK